MNCSVTANSSFTDQVRSWNFDREFTAQVLLQIQNDLETSTARELGGKNINAPIRCVIYHLSMPDGNGKVYRFRVTFNETAEPGVRTLYDIQYRELDMTPPNIT